MKTSIRIKIPSRWNRNYLVEALKEKGLEGDYTQGEIDTNTDVLVTNYLSNEEVEKLTRLRRIVIPTSGIEGIDLQKLETNGIEVYQNKQVISQGVVEYFLDNVRKLSGEPLEKYFDKKNISLLGFGNIGERIYASLKEYNCQFWVIRKRLVKPFDKIVYCNDLEGLDNVIESCDIVVNTLPLSKETKGIGENKTSLFKPESVIVNLSRAGILNEERILDRIRKGTLNGAIFDVYPRDVDSDLYSNNKNIILTNHIAAIHGNNLERIAQSIKKQVELFV